MFKRFYAFYESPKALHCIHNGLLIDQLRHAPSPLYNPVNSILYCPLIYILLSCLLTYSMEQIPSWKLSGSQLVTKTPHFMEPKLSLPHSQVPATCPYPEPYRPIQPPLPSSWRPISILFSHTRLDLPNGLLLSGFPTKTRYTPLLSPITATCCSTPRSCKWSSSF